MDFSASFVALRDRMREGQDKKFESRQNVAIAGRTSALFSGFGLSEQRKLLGLMPLGGSTHAHEYRLLFAVPELTEAALLDWWSYALAAERELVQPDKTHEFSMVSLILAASRVERPVQKQLKRLQSERRFTGEDENGWSTIRIAAVDLEAGRVYTNRMGDALRGIITPFLQKDS